MVKVKWLKKYYKLIKIYKIIKKRPKIPIFYFIMINGNKIKYYKKTIKNGKKRFGNFFGIGHL